LCADPPHLLRTRNKRCTQNDNSCCGTHTIAGVHGIERSDVPKLKTQNVVQQNSSRRAKRTQVGLCCPIATNHIAFSSAQWVSNRNSVIAVIIGATFLLGCSQPSEPQPKSAQSPGEQARNEVEDKAWVEASRNGTVAAITAYLQHYGSGPHAAEARQRLAMVEQAQKDEEKKAWADAFRAGIAAALREYLQHHGSGAHAADARHRLSVLEKLENWDEDKTAWADASRTRTVAAFRDYLQHHGSGAHAADARQRLAVLERQARWDEEQKARADATLSRTAAATTRPSEIRSSGTPASEPRQRRSSGAPAAEPRQRRSSGAPAAEPRQRLSALEEHPRKEVELPRRLKIPAIALRSIDIRTTCRISADVGGAAPGRRTDDACMKSERDARDEVVKHWTEFSSAERASCINYNVYLPSYVEWLTCLEMQRDVRKLKTQATPSKRK
jgi:hypothetical protein